MKKEAITTFKTDDQAEQFQHSRLNIRPAELNTADYCSRVIEHNTLTKKH